MKLLRHWKIGLCLLAIFLAGSVTGGVATVGYVKHKISQTGAEGVSDQMLRNLRRQLQLTPEQVEQLRPAFDRAAQEFARVRQEAATEVFWIVRRTNAEVERELTSEQQVRFREIRRKLLAKIRERYQLKPDEPAKNP
jgi:uncharacterized membrane protein